jgi:ATP-binding cassette subfamily F protein uup
MAPPLLSLQGIHLTFGGTPLLEGAALALGPGERLCLVGRNGSGKSTLLKIAAGLIEPDGGKRFVQPGASIRYLPQEPDFALHGSTFDYVAEGLGAEEGPHRARMLLNALGLAGDEEPARLSGGEARRAALARVLAPRPDILLLDEPTNHLDLPTIEWLESEIASLRSALAIVSHDRRFLSNLSQKTLWLDRGTTRLLDEGFGQFEAWREAVLEAEERDRHKLDRKIVAEEDWLRYGVTARRKRNQGRLADLQALRRRRRELKRQPDAANLALSEAEVSGTMVLEAKKLAKSYADKPVVVDFSLRVVKGDRIGIVGPNGAGKTTLLGLLTGELQPDRGSLRLGANLKILSLDQRRALLDPERTVAETLTDGRGDTVVLEGGARHVIGVMRDFLFAPEQARTPVRALSGGERGRLMLAKAFLTPSNLLVLDEPTNDLDLETLDLFQEKLAEYGGTLVLVSHDRDFLDRVASSIVAYEGDGRWLEYAGGYSDMLAQRRGGPEPAPAAKVPRERKAAPAAAKQAAPRRRLSFKEKHALERLPQRIGSLEAEIESLRRELADPALYGRDAARYRTVADRLAAAEAELQGAEEEWLALALAEEQIERGKD